MEETLYQVCITGNILPPADRGEAIAAYAGLFSIPAAVARQRFGGAPCTARGGLTREQAEKYCRVMRRLGIECSLEPELPAGTGGGGPYPRLSGEA